MSAFEHLAQQLAERQATGLYRSRRIVESAQGRELIVDGRRLLNFCSNDYLGLANDARVRASLQKAVAEWGVGSGGSHLVTGHTRVHAELEEALADFTGRPRCLLFSSGYAANMGTINGLLSRTDHVYEDRLNHASLLDGGRLSGARFKRYRHLDLDDLNRQLDKVTAAEARKLIVSDGTFSMDGTTCNTAGLIKQARAADAWLMIDEAHSLGVLGEQGRGLVAGRNHNSDEVQVLIGTLGKSFGTQGGFAAGSEELIETLIQAARTYIYSTALPSAVAAATLTSLTIAREEEWRRERLQQLINRFRSGAAQLGLHMTDSATPIQPVLLGDADAAVALSKKLEARGVLITAIRPPTVPAGTSRLRITLTAAHTDADIDQLLSALAETRSP